MTSILVSSIVLVFLLGLSEGRTISSGPTIDPGVFVVTYVDSCRSGEGFCVLGAACGVDADFEKDDLGGNCDSLKDAFMPKSSFVCCMEKFTS